jgi:hypothetical protein
MSACSSPVIAAVIAVLVGAGCAVNAAGRTPLEQQDYDFATQRAIEHAG